MRKESDMGLVFRVFSFQGAMRKKYWLGLYLAASESVIFLLNPEINKLLIQMVTGEAADNAISHIAILFVILLALAPLVAYGKYLQGISCDYGVKALRCTLFSHMQSLPLSEMANQRTGDMMTRLTNDVDRAGNMFQSFGVVSLVRFAIVLPTGFVLLLFVDGRIALMSLIYCGITLALATRLNPYVRKLEREARAEIASLANYLIEALRNIPVIRVFLLQPVLAQKYEAICRVIFNKRAKFRTMNGIAYGVVDLFAFSARALGFIAALLLGLGGGSDIANVVYAATLVGIMGDASLSGSTFLLLIQSSLVAAKRVMELFDRPIENDRTSISQVQADAALAVELSNLSFAYQDETPVVSELTLRIKPGEHIALVGGSGGGKSTVVKLIAGLYETSEGQITLFGADAQLLSLEEQRALCSYIPQECTLYDQSIGDNIGLGRPGCTRDEIVLAAKRAGIHDFICTLPNGYDTLVGESGSQLSGGQKQRVAIARAILKDAPILLMDEATAALDSAMEQEVLTSLAPLMAKSTTISVAHRLSTIQNADCIYVMDEGRIVEQGTHQELLHQKGPYYALYQRQ